MNIVLFDGICNLCNASVRFISKHDKYNTIQFASLQSETAKELLLKMNIDSQKIDSIIFVSNEKVFFKSDAAIEIAKRMDGFPRLLKSSSSQDPSGILYMTWLPKTGTACLGKPVRFNPHIKTNEKIIPSLSIVVFVQRNFECTVK